MGSTVVSMSGRRLGRNVDIKSKESEANERRERKSKKAVERIERIALE